MPPPKVDQEQCDDRMAKVFEKMDDHATTATKRHELLIERLAIIETKLSERASYLAHVITLVAALVGAGLIQSAGGCNNQQTRSAKHGQKAKMHQP